MEILLVLSICFVIHIHLSSKILHAYINPEQAIPVCLTLKIILLLPSSIPAIQIKLLKKIPKDYLTTHTLNPFFISFLLYA